MKEIEKYNETILESIKHIDEKGNEYWEARELQKVLDYKQWRKFEERIVRAKEACENSRNEVSLHFANSRKCGKRNDQKIRWHTARRITYT